MNSVRTGDKSNPPFLNASPIAKIPHPTFPFSILINVSRYLKMIFLFFNIHNILYFCIQQTRFNSYEVGCSVGMQPRDNALSLCSVFLLFVCPLERMLTDSDFHFSLLMFPFSIIESNEVSSPDNGLGDPDRSDSTNMLVLESSV